MTRETRRPMRENPRNKKKKKLKIRKERRPSISSFSKTDRYGLRPDRIDNDPLRLSIVGARACVQMTRCLSREIFKKQFIRRCHRSRRVTNERATHFRWRSTRRKNPKRTTEIQNRAKRVYANLLVVCGRGGDILATRFSYAARVNDFRRFLLSFCARSPGPETRQSTRAPRTT